MQYAWHNACMDNTIYSYLTINFIILWKEDEEKLRGKCK